MDFREHVELMALMAENAFAERKMKRDELFEAFMEKAEDARKEKEERMERVRANRRGNIKITKK